MFSVLQWSDSEGLRWKAYKWLAWTHPIVWIIPSWEEPQVRLKQSSYAGPQTQVKTLLEPFKSHCYRSFSERLQSLRTEPPSPVSPAQLLAQSLLQVLPVEIEWPSSLLPQRHSSLRPGQHSALEPKNQSEYFKPWREKAIFSCCPGGRYRHPLGFWTWGTGQGGGEDRVDGALV